MAWIEFENNKGGVDIDYIIETKIFSDVSSNKYYLNITYIVKAGSAESGRIHVSEHCFESKEARDNAMEAINTAMKKKFNTDSSGVVSVSGGLGFSR